MLIMAAVMFTAFDSDCNGFIDETELVALLHSALNGAVAVTLALIAASTPELVAAVVDDAPLPPAGSGELDRAGIASRAAQIMLYVHAHETAAVSRHGN
jgi:hypothetical protein